VSLLNDCKYGHDVKENLLRLSLLRSPADPDPKADEGEHRFTYSLYPHGGDWRNGTVQQGFELNNPMIAVGAKASKGSLPPVDALVSVDAENVIVDAVKKHEDSDAMIVRVYEAYGQRGPFTLTFGRKPARVTECDCMEENDAPVTSRGNGVSGYITPYEIRTFKVVFD
jgi:alpha-mannosidase